MTATATIEPENGSLDAKVSAFRALSWASLHLGNPALANAIGVEERSLRAKLAGERGISDLDLSRARAALASKARAIAVAIAAIDKRLELP